MQKSGQATSIALLRQWSFNVSGLDGFTPCRLRWCHMWAKIGPTSVFTGNLARLQCPKKLETSWKLLLATLDGENYHDR